MCESLIALQLWRPESMSCCLQSVHPLPMLQEVGQHCKPVLWQHLSCSNAQLFGCGAGIEALSRTICLEHLNEATMPKF